MSEDDAGVGPVKQGEGATAIEARLDAIISAIFVNAQDAGSIVAEE
jgi:hypothetical protein